MVPDDLQCGSFTGRGQSHPAISHVVHQSGTCPGELLEHSTDGRPAHPQPFCQRRSRDRGLSAFFLKLVDGLQVVFSGRGKDCILLILEFAAPNFRASSYGR